MIARFYSARYELAMVLLSLVMAGLAFGAARRLPAPIFEPLGSAAFPKAVVVVLVALVVIKLVMLFLQKVEQVRDQDEALTGVSDFRKALGMLCLIGAFAVLAQSGIVPFWAAVLLFVFLSMSYLKWRPDLPQFGYFALFAVVFAVLVGHFFIRLFHLSI